jgi:hypothetical protein
MLPKNIEVINVETKDGRWFSHSHSNSAPSATGQQPAMYSLPTPAILEPQQPQPPQAPPPPPPARRPEPPIRRFFPLAKEHEQVYFIQLHIVFSLYDIAHNLRGQEGIHSVNASLLQDKASLIGIQPLMANQLQSEDSEVDVDPYTYFYNLRDILNDLRSSIEKKCRCIYDSLHAIGSALDGINEVLQLE